VRHTKQSQPTALADALNAFPYLFNAVALSFCAYLAVLT